MNNKEALRILKSDGPLMDMSYSEWKKGLSEAIKISIKALMNVEKLLSMCDQCQEYNGQTLIHIEDVRRILR